MAPCLLRTHPAAGFPVLLQQRLHAGEHLRIDDRRVLACVDLVLVPHLADVRRVGEQLVQAALVERPAAPRIALLGRPLLGLPAPAVQFLHDGHQRAEFQVQGEDLADLFGFGFDHDQLRVHDIVAQERHPARPLALPPGGGDLVAGPFRDHLAFELGEREQHVQDQPAHRRGRVELLGDRHERHLVPLEHLHHPGEVQQAAAQAVHLVDHDAVDHAGLDVGHQPFQGRAVHVAAGESAVVVLLRAGSPSLRAAGF